MNFLSQVSSVTLLAFLFASSCSSKSNFATVKARSGASKQESTAVGSAGKPEGADTVETAKSSKASDPISGEGDGSATVQSVPESAGEGILSSSDSSVASESLKIPGNGSGVEVVSKPSAPVENGGVPSAPVPSVSFKIAVDQLKNNAGYNNCLEVSVNGAPLQKVACTKDDLSEVKTIVFPAKAWPACNVIRLSYTSYGYRGNKLYTRSTEDPQMIKDYIRVAARQSQEFQLNYEDLLKTDPSIDWDFNDYVASFKVENKLNLSVENSDQLVCQPE